MSDQDDLYGVTQPPISEELAERLLSGSGSGQDAASVGLDALFDALRAPGDPSELSGMEAAVAAFQGAAVTPFAGPPTPRTRTMRKKLLTAKTIATIGAVTLATAGAAAAATGTVPSPFASDNAKEVTAEHVPEIALENVGKHVDDPPTVTETTVPVVVAPVDQTDANESARRRGHRALMRPGQQSSVCAPPTPPTSSTATPPRATMAFRRRRPTSRLPSGT